MFKPINEALYDEIVNGEILLHKVKQDEWFLGRTVRNGFGKNEGFKFFSFTSDNCIMTTFTDKHHAIRQLKDGRDDIEIYVADKIYCVE